MEENILKKANEKRILGDIAIEGGNFNTAFFKKVVNRLPYFLLGHSKTIFDFRFYAAGFFVLTSGSSLKVYSGELCFVSEKESCHLQTSCRFY